MSKLNKYAQLLTVLPFTFGSLMGYAPNGSMATPYSDLMLASHEISLENRQPDPFVNKVFKNNILLNIAYMSGKVTKASDINWEEINKPFVYEFKLKPYETFAYHEDVKEKYKQSLVKTTVAHFNASDGFLTDGYLYGDGICHLASLIYWVALDAGLLAEAPTNHDFAPIPDIAKKYGVSIYYSPGSASSNARQNLYITNNRAKTVAFKFEYRNNTLKVSATELNK